MATGRVEGSEPDIVILGKKDIEEARALCEECFPIVYPDSWYQKTFKSRDPSSLSRGRIPFGISSQGKLVALLVANIQSVHEAEEEGVSLDSSCTHFSMKAVYLSILGVTRSHRSKGYATKLLFHLLGWLSSRAIHAKVIYLHVLASNAPALSFYHKHGFQVQEHISNYYELQDGFHTGILCTKYVNGGKPKPALMYRAYSMMKYVGMGCLGSVNSIVSWAWEATSWEAKQKDKSLL